MSWSLSTPSSSLPDASGSQLLSESLPSPESFDLHSYTGPGGADLSLSELSISDKDTERFHFHDRPRFSLLAPAATTSPSFSPDQSRIAEEDEEYGEGNDEHSETKLREDKLQSDVFILKKLNASFALFNDALRSTQTATEQVATQLAQTDALLDRYVNMLGKSEAVAKLIFDERWEGAEADEESLQKERQEALEQARIEKERLEREEEERREAEQRARLAAEEAARIEAEGRTAAATKPPRGRGTSISSGVRGVRGTRATATSAAARGTRGIPRAASTSASAIPRTRPVSSTGSVSTSGGTRPGSSSSRGSGLSRGIPRRG
ncbi:hypothetical protein M405DRAFT_873324 [Rhizopogon salebrosus TDB-379]|nr:hypothetical protein M405DRAFT_873324 [Rhizopogon salebrosus TDB-379]